MHEAQHHKSKDTENMGKADSDTPSPNDIYIISDLHLGKGRNPKTGRYFTLEAFLYDHDFYRLCKHLNKQARRRQRAYTLVINGDAFDFLRIRELDFPDNHDPSAREKLYGACLTPSITQTMMERIVAGHPRFIEGLALILDKGNDVVIMPGNHDLEVQWQGVRQVLRDGVAARLEDPSVIDRFRFEEWFYYEPGRIWIEHGCQYDPENAYRYYLRKPLEGEDAHFFQTEQDQPLGNFFQRYLYNTFGAMTFMVPSTTAGSRYFRWLLLNKPSLIARMIFQHVPFAMQAVRKIASNQFGIRVNRVLSAVHERRLAELAEQSGLEDKLYTIDKMKQQKSDVVAATEAFFKGLIWTLLWFGLGGVGLVTLWGFGLQFITATTLGLTMKSVLLAVHTTLLFLLVVAGAIVFTLRDPPKFGKIDNQLEAAKRIHTLLDVPIVTFGHTHVEVVEPLNEQSTAWFFNTGTWVATFSNDFVPRDRVQYSVLRIRDFEGELMAWRPDRRELIPVPLIDEELPLF